MTVTASKEASAVRASTASGTLVSVPCPTAATPRMSTAHRVRPVRPVISPLPRPVAAAERRASAVSFRSAAAAAANAASCAPNACRSAAPESRSVTVAPSSPRAAAVALAARRDAATASGGAAAPAASRPEGQHAAGRREDEQADGHRARADQRGGQRRADTADEEVLGGVHVTDQRGQQITGAEGGQPGRREPLQPAVDRHPDVSQHPERDIVGRQPLEIARHAAADAERADRDDGHGDRQDVRVLRGAGEQEPRCGQQGHAAAGGCCAGQDREDAAGRAAAGPAGSAAAAAGGRRSCRGVAAHGSTAVALRPRRQASRGGDVSFP